MSTHDLFILKHFGTDSLEIEKSAVKFVNLHVYCWTYRGGCKYIWHTIYNEQLVWKPQKIFTWTRFNFQLKSAWQQHDKLFLCTFWRIFLSQALEKFNSYYVDISSLCLRKLSTLYKHLWKRTELFHTLFRYSTNFANYISPACFSLVLQ